MVKRIEADREKRILSLFKNGESYSEIASKVGVSRATVGRTIKRNELNGRIRYSLNESFFEKIDTEEKAYFLGLLYADGYIGEGKWNNIVLLQKDADKHILGDFKKAIQFTGEIKNEGKGGYENSTERFSVRFTSEKMAEDLRGHGLFSNKSLTMEELPTMGGWLYRHFIRGYFDGDGSIWSSVSTSYHTLASGEKKKYENIKHAMSIIGTPRFLGNMRNQIVNVDMIDVSFRIIKSKTEGIEYLSSTGKENLTKLREYLYSGSKVYLNRKYTKWNEVDCPYNK